MKQAPFIVHVLQINRSEEIQLLVPVTELESKGNNILTQVNF